MMNTLTATLALASVTSALSPFSISGLLTHQPTGNPGGQVNYYRIAFSVNSTHSGQAQYGYCAKFWGDNSWAEAQAYSVHVPTGQWLSCDTSNGAYDGAARFEFQLFPFFSIGNFSLAIKEDIGDDQSVYAFDHVTNKTDAYTCDINPQQLPDHAVHASGDCNQPSGSEPLKFRATSSDPTA